MMIARMLDFITDTVANHGAAVVGGSVSVLGTTALAAGAVPVPQSVPDWLPYVVTIFGPAALVGLTRGLSALAQARRTIAEKKRKRAAQLRADNDKSNDALAEKLDDEADFNDALADGLDVLAAKRRREERE